MEIQLGNYTLTSEEDRFNLTETRVTQKKDGTGKLTGETGTTVANIGFSMSLIACIEAIIRRNIGDQQITVDLPTYIRMYKEETAKIKNLLK